MMNMQINILLPKNRKALGHLTVVEGAETLFECECLGLADQARATAAGNPTRDPIRKNGDTPTGTYQATVAAAPSLPLRSYGPFPLIHLTPVSDQALEAARNGRSGLAIHSGDLNSALTWWHGLRPTEGCVRIPSIAHGRLCDEAERIGLSVVLVTEVPR